MITKVLSYFLSTLPEFMVKIGFCLLCCVQQIFADVTFGGYALFFVLYFLGYFII